MKTIERSKAEQLARSEVRGPCDINRWDNMAKDFTQRTSGEKASVKWDATPQIHHLISDFNVKSID